MKLEHALLHSEQNAMTLHHRRCLFFSTLGKSELTRSAKYISVVLSLFIRSETGSEALVELS